MGHIVYHILKCYNNLWYLVLNYCDIVHIIFYNILYTAIVFDSIYTRVFIYLKMYLFFRFDEIVNCLYFNNYIMHKKWNLKYF